MTVSIAWVRTIRDCEELMFASDSRLSGDGAVIDQCPKIMTLPRSDCAICFAGYTGTAYAIINQLAFAISAHEPSRRRSMDLRKLRTHMLKVFNTIAASIETDIDDLRHPDVTFIFGGYSWVHKEFDIWGIGYNSDTAVFEARPAPYALTHPRAKRLFFGSVEGAHRNNSTILGKIAFGGDQGEEAKHRFQLLMNEMFEQDPSKMAGYKLDKEPLMVLRDMLRDPQKSHTIGGAMQVVKVYQYMSASPLAVYWPNKQSGQVTLLGRRLLDFENIDCAFR